MKVAVFHPVTADGAVWKPGLYENPGPQLIAIAESKREFNGRLLASIITADVNEEEIKCPHCGFVAKTKRGLHLHMQKCARSPADKE